MDSLYGRSFCHFICYYSWTNNKYTLLERNLGKETCVLWEETQCSFVSTVIFVTYTVIRLWYIGGWSLSKLQCIGYHWFTMTVSQRRNEMKRKIIIYFCILVFFFVPFMKKRREKYFIYRSWCSHVLNRIRISDYILHMCVRIFIISTFINQESVCWLCRNRSSEKKKKIAGDSIL